MEGEVLETAIAFAWPAKVAATPAKTDKNFFMVNS
jgi:hypothetical protein